MLTDKNIRQWWLVSLYLGEWDGGHFLPKVSLMGHLATKLKK